MENSAATIKLFNEVMDYLDSLTAKEFDAELKKSENSELANLLLRAGYFSKIIENRRTEREEKP